MNLIQNPVVHLEAAAFWELDEPSLALHEAYAKGRAAWNALSVSYEQFLSYLTQRGQVRVVAPRCPAEVYLCVACELGQNAAYQALEAWYFPALKPVIIQLLGERPAADDLLQEVRSRLLVGCPPKIATYRGDGSLSGWLRRIAVNAAQDYLRERNVRREGLRRLATLHVAVTPGCSGSTEDYAFRSQCARLCENAWMTAFQSLDSSDRQLLYHYYVSSLSIDTLGPLYAVHRATIARRIRRVTARVRRLVRESLAVHYPDLSARDLDALAVDCYNELDLSDAWRGQMAETH